MKLQTHFREALSNLLSAKMRSVLAVLGVLVGTASVVALITGGELATEHALEQFKKLGTDTFAVAISSSNQETDSGLSKRQTLDRVLALPENIHELRQVAPYVMTMGSIEFQSNTINGFTLGVTQTLQQMLKLTISQGRGINALDTNEYYCVIGKKLVADLHKAGAIEILGQQLLVGDQYFSIIGILDEAESNLFMFVNLNKSVLIPIETALVLDPRNFINNILFKVKSDKDIDKVTQPITDAIHDIYPGKQIYFRSPQQIITSMKNQSKTFNLLLGFIGSISLVVGGIGVMNIMLVSVVERKKEIGIRLAVGAKRSDIQWMFLTEAVALTIFGGFLGVILGETIALITAQVSDWAFHFYPIPPIIGFLVSALTGIFFGFYPARKAAMLDPIESLRSD